MLSLKLGSPTLELLRLLVSGDLLTVTRSRLRVGRRFGGAFRGLLTLECLVFTFTSASSAFALTILLETVGLLIHRAQLPYYQLRNRPNGKAVRQMAPPTRVRLLEVDPDLGVLLSAEELAEARQLAVPVVTIEHDEDLELLSQPVAFGALVVHGVVLHELQIADQRGMRLLGPGDVLPLSESSPPMLVADTSFRTLPGTRLALLGRELMFAATRWPALLAALQQRAAQQAERLAAQLVVCQLPRVDQRLLALLWLIAESWGRVTAAGTVVPLRLTHEALGALIGARRPTVTLALRELTDRGAIVRQSDGWLLLEDPPKPTTRAESIPIPPLLEVGESPWRERSGPDAAAAAAAATTTHSFELLKETLATLREQHDRDRNQFEVRMGAFATARERCRESRVRIARERVSRRPSPSS